MWTHLLEVVLATSCLAAGPFMLIAAMGGSLMLVDRLVHFFGRNDG